jgi:hypothetical protein
MRSPVEVLEEFWGYSSFRCELRWPLLQTVGSCMILKTITAVLESMLC